MPEGMDPKRHAKLLKEQRERAKWARAAKKKAGRK